MSIHNNIRVYLYKIKLLDPLFYSREGLTASYTVPYLHATAVNLSVKCAINHFPEEFPFLIKDEDNISRNNPRYENSLISDEFYFTPARLLKNLKYFPEVTKGENDGYIFFTKQGELFQASTLNYIPPESIFQGFLIEKIKKEKKYKWPTIVRLGSFRGKAKLEIYDLEIKKFVPSTSIVVSHPVDPLVSLVKRGILINMFPYPIVENAVCSNIIITKENYLIALPEKWEVPRIEYIKVNKEPPII